MEIVTSYKTQDGKIFETEEEAVAHETFLETIKKLRLYTAEILNANSIKDGKYKSEYIEEHKQTIFYLAPSVLAVEQNLFNNEIRPAINIDDKIERNITIDNYHDREENTIEDLLEFIQLASEGTLKLTNAEGEEAEPLLKTVLESIG